ncbi:uncharacterized protein UV8b_06891 [Ustilaginoidea virens]|uniref:Urease accessory protein UreF n=1 Tax=Ustilaginoidea virens TaxID=1159556 RepID=A0A1B5L0D3_USTVR|nr:uncharacterized protein UV8b_06891 [Ustilaginoidea virens]QUC22650.1 hypothetical protein UV8b_06891 [Ustilaginoidea virens]GAO16849.1 hypothetical protein UVI_02011720 [Ustilaginoidea virens]
MDPIPQGAGPEDAADAVRHEIAQLEERLAAAKARLPKTAKTAATPPPQPPLDSPTHYLLLLSDSQLPIGSFAFSSGLESYLAHSHSRPPRRPSFSAFLPLSLSSFAGTTLPFVLAAHRDPSSLVSLDDQLDAAVVCTVGRRASVAQGRALLSVWERSFRAALPAGATHPPALGELGALLRQAPAGGGGADGVPAASAHLAPLFGVVCALVGLSLRQTAYVYMVSHAKALVSAAVRAGVFGPYQAQNVLAGEQVQSMIARVIDREWDTPVEEAGQGVPVMDLWIGRHEMLYSRIFNS